MKVSTSVAGILVGVLVAPFALLLAIISAGAGHGHYVAAKLWFPFTMVSTYFLGSITTPFVALAVFQYPIYGWLVGTAVVAKKARIAAWVVSILHVASATFLYLKPPQYFE